MDAFVSRKRRRLFSPPCAEPAFPSNEAVTAAEEDSTEFKLAVLASLHPYTEQHILLNTLLDSSGSVEEASRTLSTPDIPTSPKKIISNAHQSSLSSFATSATKTSPHKIERPLTKKGRTLHLYSPEDVAAHTPCSIIHNFLPATSADTLLEELLTEATTFERQTFKLFDNVVQSPHSACFYVANQAESHKQKTEYLYNGSYLTVSLPSPHKNTIPHP